MTLQEPTLNQIAPNFTLPAHTASNVSLADYVGRQNVVLFFVRAPSCWQCRMHVEQLARMYPEFQRHNTEILVIVYTDAEGAKSYADKLKVPFPVLADAEHSVYERYGLNKIFLINTRTASVVIDKNGNIAYIRSSINPNTWLKESRQVLEEVSTLAR